MVKRVDYSSRFEFLRQAAFALVRDRRAGRWDRLPEDPDEAARTLMHRLLPDERSRINEELVWLRLAVTHSAVPRSHECARILRHDFQIAERGWSDVETDDLDRETRVEPTSGEVALAPYFADRETHLDTVIGRVLTLLEVDDREAENVRLRALVDGLTTAVCLGRISPAEGVQGMDRHLADLRRPPVRVAG
jgi:hypothetical protein